MKERKMPSGWEKRHFRKRTAWQEKLKLIVNKIRTKWEIREAPNQSWVEEKKRGPQRGRLTEQTIITIWEETPYLNKKNKGVGGHGWDRRHLSRRWDSESNVTTGQFVANFKEKPDEVQVAGFPVMLIKLA